MPAVGRSVLVAIGIMLGDPRQIYLPRNGSRDSGVQTNGLLTRPLYEVEGTLVSRGYPVGPVTVALMRGRWTGLGGDTPYTSV
jgi:hypothetical protein